MTTYTANNVLVLSLFPGIGLLDMAFEEEGFCVVRGPDLLWGGDIRRFHPPAGKFSGVIGGPPCQAFSDLVPLIRAVHGDDSVADNLIPEYERVAAEAAPAWFLMENVPRAPRPSVNGYIVRETLLRDVWVGGETSRLRRFCFGTHDGATLEVETLALHRPDPEPAVLCDTRVRPIAVGGSGKRKPKGYKTSDSHRGPSQQLSAMCQLQGLPFDFFDASSPLTVEGKKRMIGNGVPLPMGRAVARAVRQAILSRGDANLC